MTSHPVVSGAATSGEDRTDADALEELRIYLSWVPPGHAQAAFRAFDEVDAQLARSGYITLVPATVYDRARAALASAPPGEEETG